MAAGLLADGCRLPAAWSRPAALALANGAAVATIYLNQAIVRSIAASFPQSAWLSLLPTATLAGYAAGVGCIAFGPSARGLLSLERHLGLLAAALMAAGMARSLPALVAASFFIGCGAAVAQRLLATAAELAGPAAAGTAIARVVCCALTAVLGIKLVAASVAEADGWRCIFFAAAAVVFTAGLLTFVTRGKPGRPLRRTSGPGVLMLWRANPLLRSAAIQHASLFAAYNAGWMVVLIEMAAHERPAVVIGGGMAGLLAALLAGRLTDRGSPWRVVLLGSVAMVCATLVAVPFGYSMAPGYARILMLVGGMAMIDAGLQFALVANQARVQALQPAMRSRLAATLTIFGSLGGAFGAGAAYWLWARFGWEAAIAMALAAALIGIGCSFAQRSYEHAG